MQMRHSAVPRENCPKPLLLDPSAIPKEGVRRWHRKPFWNSGLMPVARRSCAKATPGMDHDRSPIGDRRRTDVPDPPHRLYTSLYDGVDHASGRQLGPWPHLLYSISPAGTLRLGQINPFGARDGRIEAQEVRAGSRSRLRPPATMSTAKPATSTAARLAHMLGFFGAGVADQGLLSGAN